MLHQNVLPIVSAPGLNWVITKICTAQIEAMLEDVKKEVARLNAGGAGILHFEYSGRLKTHSASVRQSTVQHAAVCYASVSFPSGLVPASRALRMSGAGVTCCWQVASCRECRINIYAMRLCRRPDPRGPEEEDGGQADMGGPQGAGLPAGSEQVGSARALFMQRVWQLE